MKKINSGINLFKIFSMFMIVLLHVIGKGGVVYNVVGARFFSSYFLQNMNFCAVNCYALTTGYLMYGKKLRISRIAELWFEVLFYSVVISAVMIPLHTELFSAKNIVFSFFPIVSGKYWYMTSYFFMYLFIPALNCFAEKSEKHIYKIVITCIFVLSTLSYIIREDSFKINNGYSALWLSIMYLLGAYMKKYDIGKKIRKYTALLLYIISAACSFFFSFYFKFPMKNFLNVNVNYLQYTSPFVILCAVFLFIFFSKLNFKTKSEKFINFITPAALGVYLIHTNPFIFDYIISGIADFLNKENPAFIILGIIGISLAIFIICIVIDLLRIQLFRLIKINALCKRLDSVLKTKKKEIIKTEEPAQEAVEETITEPNV